MNFFKCFKQMACLVLSLLFLVAVPTSYAQATITSTAPSQVFQVMASESISVSVTPPSQSIAVTNTTGIGTTTPFSVTTTYTLLNQDHTSFYLYNWISSGGTYLASNGSVNNISVSINGGGAVGCNNSASSQNTNYGSSGYTAAFGVDGQYCGTGIQLLSLVALNGASPVSGNPTTTYAYTLTDSNFFKNFGTGSGGVSFTVNWEAGAF